MEVFIYLLLTRNGTKFDLKMDLRVSRVRLIFPKNTHRQEGLAPQCHLCFPPFLARIGNHVFYISNHISIFLILSNPYIMSLACLYKIIGG